MSIGPEKDPPEPAPRVESFEFADLECAECDWSEAGDSTDVGQGWWHHSKKTGHKEFERVETWRLVFYDPDRIGVEDLLEFLKQELARFDGEIRIVPDRRS